MRIHRRNSLPEPPAGRANETTDAPGRRPRWRARHRRDRENVRQAPESAADGNRTARVQAAPGETAPGETAPGETAPGETAPGETAPGETAPGETAPGETTPAEAVAAEAVA